jgi:hypothetical protein
MKMTSSATPTSEAISPPVTWSPRPPADPAVLALELCWTIRRSSVRYAACRPSRLSRAMSRKRRLQPGPAPTSTSRARVETDRRRAASAGRACYQRRTRHGPGGCCPYGGYLFGVVHVVLLGARRQVRRDRPRSGRLGTRARVSAAGFALASPAEDDSGPSRLILRGGCGGRAVPRRLSHVTNRDIGPFPVGRRRCLVVSREGASTPGARS